MEEIKNQENIEEIKEQAVTQLKKGYAEAEVLLQDEDKMERFLQRLEKKLRIVPLVGDRLAVVPVMVSLLKNYYKKEYTDIPIGTILAIISALLYFVSPIDIVPDSVPALGYFDDAGGSADTKKAGLFTGNQFHLDVISVQAQLLHGILGGHFHILTGNGNGFFHFLFLRLFVTVRLIGAALTEGTV